MQHSVIQASQPYGLGLNETLLPQYLKKLGYATHAVGKVQITNSDNDKSCTFLPAVQLVTFLLNNNTANRCTCVYLGLVYQRSDNGIQQISRYPGGMCL